MANRVPGFEIPVWMNAFDSFGLVQRLEEDGH